MTTYALEEGLVAYLKVHSGLVALVSTRIYPIEFPDGVTMPCVTWQRIDTPYTTTMSDSGATGNLTRPRFQFNAWATTAAAAKAISDQIRAALHGHTGATGGTGGGAITVTIRAALAQNEHLERDPSTRLWRSISDFVIWHEE